MARNGGTISNADPLPGFPLQSHSAPRRGAASARSNLVVLSSTRILEVADCSHRALSASGTLAEPHNRVAHLRSSNRNGLRAPAFTAIPKRARRTDAQRRRRNGRGRASSRGLPNPRPPQAAPRSQAAHVVRAGNPPSHAPACSTCASSADEAADSPKGRAKPGHAKASRSCPHRPQGRRRSGGDGDGDRTGNGPARAALDKPNSTD